MKARTYTVLGILAILLSGITIIKGQESRKETSNPFPLSETQKQTILKKCETTIHRYTDAFGSKQLDQWPGAARDSFLIAKATKINILFAPDYYRDTHIAPLIEKENAPMNDPVYPGKLSYKVTFFVDTLKEKLVSKRLFYAYIWNSGESGGFNIPVYNNGDFFRPPLWEQGKYEDWQKRNFHPFAYITGYENRRKETLDQIYQRKLKQHREEKKRKQ